MKVERLPVDNGSIVFIGVESRYRSVDVAERNSASLSQRSAK